MNTTALKVSLLASMLALFFSLNSVAQEYFMNSSTNGTTITTCSGTVYDSGGEMGSYQNNEDYVLTICSGDENNSITLYFSQFNIESSFESFCVYDGSSTSDIPITCASVSNFSGQTIISSGSCLTLRFTSDGSVTYSGFAAEISCDLGCQNYSIDIVTTDPIFEVPLSYHNEICPGSTVVFNAEGTYPLNNTSYSQTEENISWKWTVSAMNGDNEIYEGLGMTEFNYTFEEGGIYNVFLEAVDSVGCVAVAENDYRFTVFMHPDLSDIIIDPEMCAGESIDFTNEIYYDTIIYEILPATFDTICMSDEYTLQWQSMCLHVDENTSGQLITSADQIQSVCLNMEHSYIGDLDIVLECPNGQNANLVSYPNGFGAAYFGEPIDDDAAPCVPGVGYNYCFSMNANDTLSHICMYQTSTPAGVYLADSSFNKFIGCPVEGDWCIKIMDNLGSDDGVLFSFSLQFADGVNYSDTTIILTNSADLSPDTEDVFWSGPGVAPNNGITSVTPEFPGNYDYVLSIVDSLGCASETVYNVTVYDENDPFCQDYCFSMLCNEASDTINDGSGDYPSQNDSFCFWMITPETKAESDLFFYWNNFDVFIGDTLKIYQMTDDILTLFFELTGDSDIPESFVIPGTEAYITYTTNGTLRSPGWELVYQTVPTGSPVNSNGEINIYPNPSNGLFNISGLSAPANLSVIDMSGRIVLEINDFENSSLDISNLQNGLYFVKIEGDLNFMQKILKQ